MIFTEAPLLQNDKRKFPQLRDSQSQRRGGNARKPKDAESDRTGRHLDQQQPAEEPHRRERMVK